MRKLILKALFFAKLAKLVYDFPPKDGKFLKGSVFNIKLNGKIEIATVISRIYDKYSSVEAYILFSRNEYHVVFKGSREWRDWFFDFLAFMKRIFRKGVKAHYGFTRCYQRVRLKVFKELTEIVQNHEDKSNMKINFVGHSLGAAVTTLFFVRVITQGNLLKFSEIDLYTYGSPRVFNKKGYKLFKAMVMDIKNYFAYRFVNKRDAVTKMPKFGYRHVGQPLFLDGKGNVSFKRKRRIGSFKDHNLDDYIKSLESILY